MPKEEILDEVQAAKNKAVVESIQDGDYFNVIRPKGDNETWNNQNRFSTYQKVCTRKQGDWELRELFYEYSHGDYPFTSTSYWNVPTFVKLYNCEIVKIKDPYKEGVADKKAYLKDKIKDRIKEHIKNWQNTCEYACQMQVKGDKKEVKESLERLSKTLINIKQYIPFDKDLAVYSLDNIVNTGRVTPITFMRNGNKVVCNILSMNPTEKYFIVECEPKNPNLWEKVAFKDVLPNEQLYPIDFGWAHPYDSVMGKNHLESTARRILYYTDSWEKPLLWEDYEKTLSEKTKYDRREIKANFEKIKPYLESPKTCALFSSTWREMVYGK